MPEAPFKVWQCQTCGELYDEAAGLPDFGIPPGMRFVDLPDDWICPACGSAKSDFLPYDL
ncbi:rubredoxin [Zavarzinia compransoris]|uniref:Rubredoxin n=1 Tax=Zavarzinia compransoris TaxID=1264899 RepID=A0A317DUM5_9PROT|nr:rubredoxin [Zavarzinia compransoris]PWR18341.1 rubredoxin [Zavarzinia compransoris]TDP43597.1 rubredoxin [Zavarzinia compransoris]